MMDDHDCETTDPCPKCGYEAFYAEIENSGGDCPNCGHRPLGGMR